MVAVTALRGRSGRLVAREGRVDWSEVERNENKGETVGGAAVGRVWLVCWGTTLVRGEKLRADGGRSEEQGETVGVLGSAESKGE